MPTSRVNPKKNPLIQLTHTLLASAAIWCALQSSSLSQSDKALAQSDKVLAQPDKILARMGDLTVTEADLATASEDPALNVPGSNDEQKRDMLIGYVIDLKLAVKTATEAKLDTSPEFLKKLSYFKDKMLVEEYLNRKVKKSITPEAIKALYEETTKSLPPENEIRARHILVEKEDEAKAIVERLKKGEDFTKIANDVSKDPGSKATGGDLGFFSKDRMVAPFAEAAFKLEPGQISEPVKTQFGYHVIRVEEKRIKPSPTFEETKPQIENYLTRKAQQDAIIALRKSTTIERLDKPKPQDKPDEKKPDTKTTGDKK